MRTAIFTSITLISTLLFAPALAQACGESLFHVGKGVTYREYTAPLPAKILMVARTEGELLMAQRLAAAGHDVHVIADAGEIGTEIADNQEHFDIIMTLFEHRQLVEEQTRNMASAATYLPVARENSSEEDQAKAVIRYALSTDDSVKTFLRAIHKTLKQRRA